MAKRRRVLLGMGTLVFGSGAASVDAAFSSSVDQSADMRFATVGDLIVEPGIGFRDGPNADDPYVSSLDGGGPSGRFYGEENDEFFADTDPSQGGEDGPGIDIGREDLPAISVSDGTNGDLGMKLAVPNEINEWTFGEVLQVRNNTTEPKDVGVKFETFGVDTTGDQDGRGGDVDEVEVVEAFSFRDSRLSNGGSASRISTDPDHFRNNSIGDVENQRVDNPLTVDSGGVAQVDLEVSIDSTVRDQVEEASAVSDDLFSGGQDTVQLVETIRFGTDPDEDEVSGS